MTGFDGFYRPGHNLDHHMGQALEEPVYYGLETKPSPCMAVPPILYKSPKKAPSLPLRLPPSFLSRTLPLSIPGGGGMAKSLRSKREKRLRTLRREIAEPFYNKKEAAKLAAQAAALEAPKLPVRAPPQSEDAGSSRAAASNSASAMDVEMSDGGNVRSKSLKPIGSISKKKIQLHLKIKKDKRKARKGKFSKKKY